MKCSGLSMSVRDAYHKINHHGRRCGAAHGARAYASSVSRRRIDIEGTAAAALRATRGISNIFDIGGRGTAATAAS